MFSINSSKMHVLLIFCFLISNYFRYRFIAIRHSGRHKNCTVNKSEPQVEKYWKALPRTKRIACISPTEQAS